MTTTVSSALRILRQLGSQNALVLPNINKTTGELVTVVGRASFGTIASTLAESNRKMLRNEKWVCVPKGPRLSRITCYHVMVASGKVMLIVGDCSKARKLLLKNGRDGGMGEQWLFAIYVGKAKYLALNPPTSEWGRLMLAKRGGKAVQRKYRHEGRHPTEKATWARLADLKNRKEAERRKRLGLPPQARHGFTV